MITEPPGLSDRFDLAAVTRRFALPGAFVEGERWGQGHIHDTFVVRFDVKGAARRYVVQRINTDIFTDPAGMMGNIARVTKHLRHKLEAAGASDVHRRVLTVVPTHEGGLFLRDEAERCWRVYRFVEGSRSHGVVTAPPLAEAAAHAFGAFASGLRDLPGPRLVETIPHFHDARRRFDAFERAVAADARGRAADVRAEIAFARSREPLVDVPAALHARGALPERITHNDTKLDNLLFDRQTGEALCVVDLDTVMPGFVLYDFGDLMRTAASTASEDEKDLARVRLSRPNAQALLRGYIGATRAFLTPAEARHLVFGGKLTAYVTGLRFVTDYLEGDVYYRVHRPGHNLDRCRTQFTLVATIEAEEAGLARFVEEARREA